MLTYSPIGALRLAPICFDDDPAGGGTPADPPVDPPTPKADPPSNDAAFAEMRRKARDAEKRADDAEAKLAKAADDELKAQGKWKELAEAAEARADAAEAKVVDGERRTAVAAVAARLQFADPGDAFRFLDAGDMADEKLAEQALKALAKAKPYLLAKAPTRTGREVGGDIPTDKDGKPDLDAAMGIGIRDAVREMRSRGGNAALTE